MRSKNIRRISSKQRLEASLVPVDFGRRSQDELNGSSCSETMRGSWCATRKPGDGEEERDGGDKQPGAYSKAADEGVSAFQ